MGLTDFIIRLLFLSLPGLVGTLAYRSLKGRPNNYKDWEDILEIAIFSLLSYSIYGLATTYTNYQGWTNVQVTISQAVFDNNTPISWTEIAITTGIGFILAFLASYFYTRNTINQLGRLFRVTSMFGNKDVWDFYHKHYGNQWAFVRDHKTGLVYFGHIQAYSDSDKERELILKDVDVFTNSTSEFQYKCPILYISRARDDLTIELPFTDVQVTAQEATLTDGRARQELTGNKDRRSTAISRTRRKGGRESPTNNPQT